jgi:CubicO group peptidase (beta-lactamase class C family)
MKLGISKPTLLLTALLMFNFAWAEDMPTADPEDVGLSSERLERFSAEMEKGVEAGHFPGAVAAVARNGKIAFFESYGLRDKEAGLPMQDDSIFAIASMTKAITGVAVMILYEEGHFSLNDPVSKYIPAFKDSRVLVGGVEVPGKSDTSKDKKDWSQADLDRWLKENWDTLSDEEKQKWTDYYAANGKGDGKGKGKGKTALTETWEDAETVPADRPITIRDLLRHTAGISYAMGDIWADGDDLGQMIDKLAAQPLKSQPGTRFEYGLSMDVLARLVEVVSGQSFDVFIKERIFDPLDMKDTGFWVPKEQAERLVKMKQEKSDDKGSKKGMYETTYLQPPVVLMGGTGLVSTTMDYLRFCQMLLNNGELDGERILGRKAVELMHANHMNDVAEKSTGKAMVGEFQFGLTFGVKGEPGNRGELGSEGTYYWGGAYGTTFWIDPKEDLVGVFMVNGLSDYKSYDRPYSMMLEHFTYQAIVD